MTRMQNAMLHVIRIRISFQIQKVTSLQQAWLRVGLVHVPKSLQTMRLKGILTRIPIYKGNLVSKVKILQNQLVNTGIIQDTKTQKQLHLLLISTISLLNAQIVALKAVNAQELLGSVLRLVQTTNRKLTHLMK